MADRVVLRITLKINIYWRFPGNIRIDIEDLKARFIAMHRL